MAMNWPTFEEYNPEGQKTKRKAVRRSDEKGVDSKKEVFRLNKVHSYLICKSYLIFNCEREWREGHLLLRDVHGPTPDIFRVV